MPNRVSPPEYSTIYTGTNPENIIPAPKGAWFFRRNNFFFVNMTGAVDGTWIPLPYKTVVLPRPNPNKLIIYREPYELWEKKSNGFLDDFRELLPKTDWEFVSNEDVFFDKEESGFDWIFYPGFGVPPTSSIDPGGGQWSRGFTDDFYYLKSGSLWYRTPLALFYFQGVDIGEQPNLYSNPPFVSPPRYLPLPSSSFTVDSSILGVESYDRDFYYIKANPWKRSSLNIYETMNMTIF